MIPTATARGDLRVRLTAIEHGLDAGSYHPGPWTAVLRDARSLPRTDRALLADDSRASAKSSINATIGLRSPSLPR